VQAKAKKRQSFLRRSKDSLDKLLQKEAKLEKHLFVNPKRKGWSTLVETRLKIKEELLARAESSRLHGRIKFEKDGELPSKYTTNLLNKEKERDSTSVELRDADGVVRPGGEACEVAAAEIRDTYRKRDTVAHDQRTLLNTITRKISEDDRANLEDFFFLSRDDSQLKSQVTAPPALMSEHVGEDLPFRLRRVLRFARFIAPHGAPPLIGAKGLVPFQTRRSPHFLAFLALHHVVLSPHGLRPLPFPHKIRSDHLFDHENKLSV
jgi:hypothetical protein